MKNGTLETGTGFKFPTDWTGKNVKMILENQWIIVRNTHEPIIDEETFELVQKFISVKKQPNKTKRPNMFVGLVKCPDYVHA